MVRQLGKLNNSEIKIAMTQPLLLSKIEGKPLALNSPANSFHSNLDVDRRSPKERFFDKITVVNSRNFLPQISNYSAQSGHSLVSAAPTPSRDGLYFGTEDTGVEPIASSSESISISDHSRTGSVASVVSVECTLSRPETNSVTSDLNDQDLAKAADVVEAPSAVENSQPVTAAVANDILESCLISGPAKSLKKKRKSGKKKHKNSSGRQNLRSTSRRSKRGNKQHDSQAILLPYTNGKNTLQNGNVSHQSHPQEGKVRIRLKLASGQRGILKIGAQDPSINTQMGQRNSRAIKPDSGATNNRGNDAADILALYSQPMQVCQKQRTTKKVVAIPALTMVPKPPKVKKVHLNGDLLHDVANRRRSTGTSVDVADYTPYKTAEDQYGSTHGLVRVYLSERQSGTIKLHGQVHPGAPPATPTPAQLSNVVYIPSMNDIKAQRDLKVRLEELDRKDKKRQEKQVEENIRKEMLQQKEKVKALRHKQRLQIYALNEMMTQLENERFRKFKEQKERPSPKDMTDVT